ncbi:MAG: hypothetical protein ABIR26_11325, partial [Ramlibacter sp.]
IREVTRTALVLDRISSRGKHIDEPFTIDLNSITKVETESRYLTAVGYAANVVDPKPEGHA